ncbi:type IV secretion system DNA-binding domain-containing protein [Halobaculum sp. WSA2]|uniref:Type IV secretion system DNA-binding domain-containing protein n=1 Tax=Halobaculum saliterrae TaxID=2073113 RepID=A0A6B0SQ00_9EURY|nr:type IV secretion system DNA-binding domain-containing protein [Halobaculum saliterrae]MXR40527.1 type IV secretion system DNA-binding domain-containing protein [Halobaculum saliterrae]
MNLPFLNSGGYQPLQVDEELYRSLQDRTRDEGNILMQTRPYKEGPGHEYAVEVIKTFQRGEIDRGFLSRLLGNEEYPGPFSFEIWYDEGHIKFVWSVPNDYWYNTHREMMAANYPRIHIQRTDKAFPGFTPGDYVSGGYLTPDRNIYHPFKGMGQGAHGQFEDDKSPFRNITSALIGRSGTSAVAQVIFTPANSDWRERRPGWRNAGKVSRHLKEGNFVHSWFNPKIEDPTQKQLRTANAIEDMAGEPAFYVNIRYFVFGENEEFVSQAAGQIGNAYVGTYHNPDYDQQFRDVPVSGKSLKWLLEQAVGREWERETGRPQDDFQNFPLTPPELGAIAHLPNNAVETPNVQFTRRGLGSQAPADAPRKVKAVDALPFEDYTVGQTAANGGLSATRTGLQSGDSVDPAPEDAPALDGDVDESIPEPEQGAWEEGGAAQRVMGEATFDKTLQEPAEQFEGERREGFLKLHDRYESDNLTVEDLREHAETDEQAKQYIRLLEAQSEYERRYDPDNPYQGGPDNLPAPAREMDESAITPDSVEREWCFDPHTNEDRAYEVKVHDEDGNVYMGQDVKNELIDVHEEHPDSPIWLGYLKDNRVGFHEIGIEKSSWFRHMTMFGMTGNGKSTAQKNILNQIARKGYGFCYIDPKGDTVDELITEIPENRMDDVIWIEPGSEDFDQVVGINFLEATKEPGTVAYNKEVSSIVDDLVAILKGGDYWGPKMQGITTNIARAMIRSPKPFTLTDMYHVIMSKQSRRAFADMIKREGRRLMDEEGLDEDNKEAMMNIHSYTEKIAEMDDAEVDAVVRRIQSWVEDPLARGIVAHREGTVDLAESVEEGKIILVKIPIESEDLKRVVSTAVMRRIWSAIQSRREEEELREPYFTFIDEFDWVESEEMDVEAMLSKARSKKMGVGLANQNPGQITEETRDQMFANSRTMGTFGIGLPEDARLLAERLGEQVDGPDIEDIPRFVMYLRILLQGEHEEYLSDPIPVNTFADYPPERSRDEAKAKLVNSLDEYGVPPLEANINETAMLIHNLGNDEATQRHFLQAIREVQLERGAEAVALRRVAEVFEERTGRSIDDYPNGLKINPDHFNRYVQISEDVQGEEPDDGVSVPKDELLEKETPPGTIAYTDVTEGEDEHLIADTEGAVTITEEGMAFVLAADEGSFEMTDVHRTILSHGFDWFSRAGFQVSILAQSKKDDISDAEGELPGELDESSPRALKQSIERLEEEHELAYDLGDSKDITIEAEASLTKPAGPLHNLQRGVNQGKKVFFLTQDGRVNNRKREHDASTLHGYLTDPPLASRENVWEDNEGNVHESLILYNRTEFLDFSDEDEADKFALIRKGNQTVWEWDGSQLRLYDGSGPESAERGRMGAGKLDDPSVNTVDSWCRYDTYEDEWEVYSHDNRELLYDSLEELEEEWQRVRKPFLPEYEFDDLPTEDDWEIVIMPTDPEQIEKPVDAMPRVYDGEETKPLIDEDYWEQSFGQTFETALLRGFGESSSSNGQIASSHHQQLYDTVSRKFITAEKMRDEDASLPSIERNHTASVDYGGKEPLTRLFWEQVWKRHGEGVDLDAPMDASTLKTAMKGAHAMTNNREEAIQDAVLAGHLIYTDIGFFLAPPRGDRVSLVLRNNTDEYVQREAWRAVWEANNISPGETITSTGFAANALNRGPFTGDDAVRPRVRAAVKASLSRGTLEEVEDEGPGGKTIVSYRLPARDPPEEWVHVWNFARVDQEEIFPRHELPGLVENAHDIPQDVAEEHIETAIRANVLLEAEGFVSLNDPHDSSTSSIDWDLYLEEMGDGNDDSDGGSGGGPDTTTHEDSTTGQQEQAGEATAPTADEATTGQASASGVSASGDATDSSTEAPATVSDDGDNQQPAAGAKQEETEEAVAPLDVDTVIDASSSVGAHDNSPGEDEDVQLTVDDLTQEESMERFADYHITDSAEVAPEQNVDYLQVPSRTAYHAYEMFCEKNDVEPRNVQNIGDMVDYLGCKKEVQRVNGTAATRLIGVTLAQTGEELAEMHPDSDDQLEI